MLCEEIERYEALVKRMVANLAVRQGVRFTDVWGMYSCGVISRNGMEWWQDLKRAIKGEIGMSQAICHAVGISDGSGFNFDSLLSRIVFASSALIQQWLPAAMV